MGSVVREIIIDATPDAVWDTVGDFAEGPMRTSRGVLADCRLDEPDVRTLVFADGTEASERFVSRDPDARRIVFTWIGDEVVHDNASMQVFDEGEGKARVVWIHDTLPDELTGFLATTMDQLVPIIQESLARPR